MDQDPKVPMKAGVKTTEFWLAAASVVLGILLSVGTLTSETADQVGVVIGGVVAALAAAGYLTSRTVIKLKEAGKTEEATAPKEDAVVPDEASE